MHTLSLQLLVKGLKIIEHTNGIDSLQFNLQLQTYHYLHVAVTPCTSAFIDYISVSAWRTFTSSDSLDGQVESDKYCSSSGNTDLQHPPQKAGRSLVVSDCLENTLTLPSIWPLCLRLNKNMSKCYFIIHIQSHLWLPILCAGLSHSCWLSGWWFWWCSSKTPDVQSTARQEKLPLSERVLVLPAEPAVPLCPQCHPQFLWLQTGVCLKHEASLSKHPLLTRSLQEVSHIQLRTGDPTASASCFSGLAEVESSLFLLWLLPEP